MVKINRLLLWVLVCVAFVACKRGAPPRISTPVTDTANVLSDVQKQALDARLAAHRQRTGVQVALLTITTLNGEPIEDFSYRTAVAWGGGSRERNDGVLVTLAVQDRRSRIEVGYGLEAELTDGRTRGMLDGARPFLRNRDFAGAFGFILDGIEAQTKGHTGTGNEAFERTPEPAAATHTVPIPNTAPVVSHRQPEGMSVGTILLIVFGSIGSVVVIVWWFIAADRKREEQARLNEMEAEMAAQQQRRVKREVQEREQARKNRERRDREHRERETREAAMPSTPKPKSNPPLRAVPKPKSKPPLRAATSSGQGPSMTSPSLAVASVVVTPRTSTPVPRVDDFAARVRREAADRQDAVDRRRREEDEVACRQRQYEDASDSSLSSSDWFGGGGGGDYDGGGGGGDFGGGGSSSDW